MAIEIVDVPNKNGDFPYKSPFSHGFPMVFPIKMVIFHSFLVGLPEGAWLYHIHHCSEPPSGGLLSRMHVAAKH